MPPLSGSRNTTPPSGMSRPASARWHDHASLKAAVIATEAQRPTSGAAPAMVFSPRRSDAPTPPETRHTRRARRRALYGRRRLHRPTALAPLQQPHHQRCCCPRQPGVACAMQQPSLRGTPHRRAMRAPAAHARRQSGQRKPERQHLRPGLPLRSPARAARAAAVRPCRAHLPLIRLPSTPSSLAPPSPQRRSRAPPWCLSSRPLHSVPQAAGPVRMRLALPHRR